MARLLYDGDCNFCTRCANVVGDRPRVQAIPAAQPEALRDLDRLGLRGVEADTVVLVDGDRAWTESAAVVRTLWRMGRLWPLAGGLLWLTPRPLRDAGYRWVACNRHRIRI